MSKILWLDLETTGLNPLENSIIEVGAIITDENFELLNTYHYLIGDNPSWVWSQFAYEMHQKNGLLDKSRACKGRIQDCEQGLIKMVGDHYKNGEKAILAGNSIHFDKKFIERQMRDFNSLLHYRMIDVSGIIEAFRLFKNISIERPQGKHRVMDDIQDSIKLCKDCLTHIN